MHPVTPPPPSHQQVGVLAVTRRSGDGDVDDVNEQYFIKYVSCELACARACVRVSARVRACGARSRCVSEPRSNIAPGHECLILHGNHKLADPYSYGRQRTRAFLCGGARVRGYNTGEGCKLTFNWVVGVYCGSEYAHPRRRVFGVQYVRVLFVFFFHPVGVVASRNGVHAKSSRWK